MTELTNWNGRPKVQNAQIEPYKKEAFPDADFCPKGKGRSYGDASLQSTVLDATTLREILHLEGDLLEVSAGFSVGEILNFSVPKGYILPVIPGTQHVSVGGMIAADVHGKNHAQNGTIGRWIESLEIQLLNGEIATCNDQINTLLFETTIGGLGLSGVIISAKIKLIPLKNAFFEQKTQAYTSVNDLLKALEKSTAPYKTGWFDFFEKEHCLLIENTPIQSTENLNSFALKKPKISVPFKSFSWIQPFGMKLYNKRYFSKTKQQNGPVILDDVLFPLDRIGRWNYLYGKRGFHQLQWCWSATKNEDKLARIFAAIEASKHIPVLAVVKQHGDLESPGILSFPHPGFSFAFDFIYKNGLDDFIRTLHTIIAEEGGRVYLVKDALLEAENFEKMYPESVQFKASIAPFNDGRIASLLSKRLNLTP